MSFAVNTQQLTPSAGSCTETGKILEDTATGTPKTLLILSGDGVSLWGVWGAFDNSLAVDSWICAINLLPDPAVIDFVLELGKGAAGSETTIIRWSGYCKLANPMLTFTLPIPIKVPSGTRLAFRISDTDAVLRDHRVSAQYYQGLEI